MTESPLLIAPNAVSHDPAALHPPLPPHSPAIIANGHITEDGDGEDYTIKCICSFADDDGSTVTEGLTPREESRQSNTPKESHSFPVAKQVSYGAGPPTEGDAGASQQRKHASPSAGAVPESSADAKPSVADKNTHPLKHKW